MGCKPLQGQAGHVCFGPEVLQWCYGKLKESYVLHLHWP